MVPRFQMKLLPSKLRWAVRAISTFTVLALACVSCQTGRAQIAEVDLQQLIGADNWTTEERAAFEKGDAVVRSLETGNKQEIASLGIVRIKGMQHVSMQAFRDSLDQKRGDQLKLGGRFSDPPALDDVRDLELDEDSVRQLQKCKAGSCDLNLSASTIERLQNEIDWNAERAGEQAEQIIREVVLGYAREYLLRGDSGLGRYDNRRKAVDLTADHRSLISASGSIERISPELLEFLRQFPGGKLDNAESSIHWSVVDFGLKPIITVSHVTAYTQRKGSVDNLFLASKQIYTSRYLDSSLTFTILLQAAGEAGIDSYLIFADRSRSDALEGALGGLARGVVKKESVNRITTLLEKAQLRLMASARPQSNVEPVPASLIEKFIGFAQSKTALAIGAALLFTLIVVWRSRKN